MAFKKGQSGNPAGRPKGSGKKYGIEILEREKESLLRKLIGRAKEGDLKALEMCLDRLIPKLRARDALIQLPPGETFADQGREVLNAIFNGTIDASTGHKVLLSLLGVIRAVEVEELEARLAEIEQVMIATSECAPFFEKVTKEISDERN